VYAPPPRRHLHRPQSPDLFLDSVPLTPRVAFLANAPNNALADSLPDPAHYDDPSRTHSQSSTPFLHRGPSIEPSIDEGPSHFTTAQKGKGRADLAGSDEEMDEEGGRDVAPTPCDGVNFHRPL
jgi:hypothetical protein